jgi:hypothetical protein
VVENVSFLISLDAMVTIRTVMVQRMGVPTSGAWKDLATSDLSGAQAVSLLLSSMESQVLS